MSVVDLEGGKPSYELMEVKNIINIVYGAPVRVQ